MPEIFFIASSTFLMSSAVFTDVAAAFLYLFIASISFGRSSVL